MSDILDQIVQILYPLVGGSGGLGGHDRALRLAELVAEKQWHLESELFEAKSSAEETNVKNEDTLD